MWGYMNNLLSAEACKVVDKKNHAFIHGHVVHWLFFATGLLII